MCAAAPSEVLLALAADNPDTFSTAGCDAADPFLFCDFRGSGGPCRSNPVCQPEATFTNACTPETEATTCCTELLARPCETCEATPVQRFETYGLGAASWRSAAARAQTRRLP